MHLYSGRSLNSGFSLWNFACVSSVPETMVFLIELLMSILYQQNSVNGTQVIKFSLIFNDFNFTE